VAALLTANDAYEGRDLVFTRRDGQPLRPEYVLRHFHQLTDTAGLPRIRAQWCQANTGHFRRYWYSADAVSVTLPFRARSWRETDHGPGLVVTS
jgi:hypothetical protein